VVDGVIRYIGKGRKDRLEAHVIDAKRTAKRCGADTAHLYPRWHRRLVDALRAGCTVTTYKIKCDMTDKEAYQLEGKLIAKYHRFKTDQLWNTIDERFLDRRFLPADWHDPENPLYKLARPLSVGTASPRFQLDRRLQAAPDGEDPRRTARRGRARRPSSKAGRAMAVLASQRTSNRSRKRLALWQHI